MIAAGLFARLYSNIGGIMKIGKVLLVASVALFPIMAAAHGPENGGQQQKIGGYEAELVVKGTELTLYLTDVQEKKADANGFSASATVLAKDGQKTVPLTPAGANKLAGKGDFVIDGKLRATVTLLRGTTEIGKGRYNMDVK
jgi:hypothetical protein